MKTMRYIGPCLALGMLSGCIQVPLQPARPALSTQPAQIAQVGYGPYARYVVCTSGACVAPTPKTELAPAQVEAALSLQKPEPEVYRPPVAPVTEAPALKPGDAPRAQPQGAAPEEQVPVSFKSEPRPSALPMLAAGTNNAASTPIPVKASSKEYIAFPVGSARLTAEAKSRLDALVVDVKQASRVVVRGRTDERGDADSNDRLALRRAMAVHEYLRRQVRDPGVRFQLFAKGACCYIASNETEEGRAANRRAEIELVMPSNEALASRKRSSEGTS